MSLTDNVILVKSYVGYHIKKRRLSHPIGQGNKFC